MRQLIMALSILVALLVKEKFVRGQASSAFVLTAMPAQKVPVTVNKMTNLVFPMPIRAGIKVSREVLVQKVKGVENVIELKAVRPHFTPTNLSVFGLDGRLYSFELEYADNPPVLNFTIDPAPAEKDIDANPERPALLLTGLPVDKATLAADAVVLGSQKAFLHLSTRNEKMRLKVNGIYVKDSLLWFVIRISNRSLVPFHPEYLRLFLQDRKKAKRTAIQQAVIEPELAELPPNIKGHSREMVALGFPLFTVTRSKKLMLDIAEHNGGRLLRLAVSYKAILKARVLP